MHHQSQKGYFEFLIAYARAGWSECHASGRYDVGVSRSVHQRYGPRIRNFRGFKTNSMDGRGNYSGRHQGTDGFSGN